MKQTLRKILAVLVVLSIVLSVGIIAMTGSAAETVVFEETFDTGAQSAWADIARSTVENGKLHMAAVNRTTNGEWITTSYADYTVEADVQFDEVGINNSSTATAGIMGRVNSANVASSRGDGYEFALYVSTRNLSVETSVLKVRLYERGNDTSFGTSTTVNVADLLGEGNAPYNGVYHLKMVFKGSSIKCYINDALAFDVTDTSRTEGYSGVRSTTCTAYVDNFKISTETAGASSTPVSSTVSSAVSSTTSTPSGPLFFDDFNNGTLADHVTEYGWSNSNTGTLVDGRYFVNAEQHTSRYNYLKTVTALNPYFDFANCTTNDYTVEADVQLKDYKSNSFIGLVSRVTAATTNGYEFGIALTGGTPGVRLRKVSGGAIFGSGSIVPLTEFGINKGVTDTYHVKMTVLGNRIVCYVDGVKVYDETDTTCPKGVPGIRVAGGTAATTLSTGYIDNFKVTTAVIDDTTSSDTSSTGSSSQTSSSITSSDDVSSGGKYHFEDNFNSGSLHADWAYNTGSIVNGVYHLNVGGGGGNSNWVNTNAAKNLTNFAVQGDFTYQSASNTSLQPTTGISFRTQAISQTGTGGQGYEFALNYWKSGAPAPLESQKLYVRLYVRKSTGPYIIENYIPVEDILGEGNDSLTATYTLRAEVMGDKIKCFINNHVAFDVTDTTYASGAFGVRATINEATVDNLVVDEIDGFTTGLPPVGSGSGNTSSGNEPAGPYHFEDNFNSGSLHADWAYDTGSVVNGVYHLNVGGGAGNSNWVNMGAAKNLTDFAVQGDFTILSPNDGSNQATAGVSIRTQAADQTSTGGKGYEFTITYAQKNPTAALEKGKLYVRLFERNGTAPSISSDTVVPVEDILGEGNAPIDGTYTLRAEMIGNRIKCFINGYLAFDMTDDTWASGAFGIRSTVNEITADNIVVDEIDTFTTPKPPIGGKPVYTYPEGVYYQDDFSTEDFTNKGWNTNLQTVYSQVKMYNNGGAYLTNRADMLNLTDYTVEAWISIDNSEPSNTSGKLGAVVARAPAANTGYEFGLYVTGSKLQYRLYDRTKLNGTGAARELAVGALGFAYNEAYRVRLVVNGNKLYGYVGDQLVMSYEDQANNNPVGTAGIRQLGFPAYFDNYIVRESTEDEKNGVGVTITAPKADKNGIYFADNFNTKASLLGTTWNDGNATVENGKMHISSDNEVNLGGNPGFAMLKDYVVQADVTITNMKPTANASSNIISLVARGNYEFNLVYGESGSGYLRIYDRANGKAVTENHAVTVEEGKTYTLSLMVEGSKIRAFMNGELIFEKEDTALTDGIMGVRTRYTTTHFDNFVVRKITAADRTAASINTSTTPNTGDTVVYVTVALCAMLLAAAVLLLSKRRAILR